MEDKCGASEYDAGVSSSPTAAAAVAVHRIEVRTKPGLLDPRADVAANKARRLGYAISSASSARVYLVEAPLSREQLGRVMDRLLADPVVESATVGASSAPAGSVTIEVHPLPGVMDPAAQSVREAIIDLTGLHADAAQVSTGVRYDLQGLTKDQAERLGKTALGNPALHQILTQAWTPMTTRSMRMPSSPLRRVASEAKMLGTRACACGRTSVDSIIRQRANFLEQTSPQLALLREPERAALSRAKACLLRARSRAHARVR